MIWFNVESSNPWLDVKWFKIKHAFVAVCSSSSSDSGSKHHEEPPPVGYNPYSGEMSLPVAPPGGAPTNPPAPGTILPPVPGQPAVAPAPGYDAPPPYQPYPPTAPSGDMASPYPAGKIFTCKSKYTQPRYKGHWNLAQLVLTLILLTIFY